jgi:hypothetical protein
VEELLTPRCANLRIRVRFTNGRLLEINEALIMEGEILRHLDYRYHCQRTGGILVFRYDSAPHLPQPPGSPHHKHVPDATLPATRPSITEVVAQDGIHGDATP